MNTFLRRLAILNYLRSQRSPTSTEQIRLHLQGAGYLDETEIKLKSQYRLVQRDLTFLLGTDEASQEPDNDFGLTMERGLSKSLHWQLDPYQQLNYDFERMPAFMALALSVTQKHLKQVLPSDTQRELNRLFLGAESKLQQSEKKLSPVHYRRLSQAVEFFQRGQRLQAPDFDITVLDTLYRAILLGKRVQIKYRSEAELKDYDLHPFGVAIMLPKLYLVGKKQDDARQGDAAFRHFLIHKIEEIELSPFANQVPENFLLKSYLEAGNMDVLIDNGQRNHHELLIELNVSEPTNLISDLKQSPIDYSQSLTQISSNLWQLKARVQRTIQLRNWLLSLGAQARVLAPDSIRNDLIQALDAMRENYP